MNPRRLASQTEHIVQFLRTPLGLAVLCILWALLVVALVFASILLT